MKFTFHQCLLYWDQRKEESEWGRVLAIDAALARRLCDVLKYASKVLCLLLSLNPLYLERIPALSSSYICLLNWKACLVASAWFYA